jgi:mono/diheme cytochrome c family protein
VLLAGFGRPTAAAQADDHALVTKGQYLARAGDCIACHTNPGGALFAGGRAMATPFGTIYSSNITPDPTLASDRGPRTSSTGPCTPAAFPMAG